MKRKLDLSDSELVLLKILWKYENLSSGEIQKLLPCEINWTYSTTRTMVDRMVSKGFVNKSKFHGINVYSAKISKVRGLADLIKDFADKVLEIDHASVAPLFSKTQTLSKKEIKELKELLENNND